MNISSMIAREVKRALRITAKSIRRGTLGSPVGSDYTAQVHGNGDETFEGTEVWQQFGFSSRPPQGGEVLICEPNGSGEGAIIVATQDRAHKPDTSVGDSILYGSVSGSDQCKVHVKANGKIDAIAFNDIWIYTDTDMMIESDAGEIEIKADNIYIGKAGDTVIGAVVGSEALIKGVAFNTAIGLFLTSLSASLTAIRNVIGTSSGSGSGLALAMYNLAVDPGLTPPTPASCAAVVTLCDAAYNALTLTIAAIATFQSALSGLLTLQVKAS